jgi:hypothetical protein
MISSETVNLTRAGRMVRTTIRELLSHLKGRWNQDSTEHLYVSEACVDAFKACVRVEQNARIGLKRLKSWRKWLNEGKPSTSAPNKNELSDQDYQIYALPTREGSRVVWKFDRIAPYLSCGARRAGY